MASLWFYRLRRRWRDVFGWGRAPLVTGGEEEEERRRTPQKWRGVKRPEGTLYFAHNGQLV
ncbi:MAG: hypothetical protein PHZ19_08265, partial [Candidatus Thermoplasmatota archaeon]|nr:hypothetical protein [Candidatus Thermoplasmatota archaeon]